MTKKVVVVEPAAVIAVAILYIAIGAFQLHIGTKGAAASDADFDVELALAVASGAMLLWNATTGAVGALALVPAALLTAALFYVAIKRRAAPRPLFFVLWALGALQVVTGAVLLVLLAMLAHRGRLRKIK